MTLQDIERMLDTVREAIRTDRTVITRVLEVLEGELPDGHLVCFDTVEGETFNIEELLSCLR